MTVKSVQTLGANPLILMEKLAAAGGLTLIQDKKVSDSSGKSFAYKVVAQIKDGLYIEALDSIYNLLNTNTKAVPRICQYSSGYSGTILAQEATAADARKYAAATFSLSLGTFEDAVPVTILDKSSLSVMFSLPIGGPAAKDMSAEYGANLYYNYSFDRSKILLTDDLNSGESIIQARASVNTQGFAVIGSTRGDSSRYPMGIINSALRSRDLSGRPSNNSYAPATTLFFGAHNSTAYSAMPLPCVVSGADFRLGRSVDSNGELENPTSWNALPIYTNIASDGSGLIFSVPGKNGEFLIITTVDTSKGNKMSGIFPVSYTKTLLEYNPDSAAETQVKVLGDETATTTELTMNEYVPSMPIANDSVKGGPVVTYVFAVGADEIRGTIGEVLSCSNNVAIGTTGWLDGEKYKAIYPGRMIKIG